MIVTVVEFILEDGSKLTVGVHAVLEVRQRKAEQVEPLVITLQPRSLARGVAYGFASFGRLARALDASGSDG
ncbi:MAG: hypothetical protein JNL82_00615 [Myxococcales bacterium]|nr:hypothetical protein [Myxococcales bacterium]